MDTSETRRDYLILARNALRCLACNKVIESKHRHDYVVCGCPNEAMVDGGLDYIRRGAVNMALLEDLSEYTMPDCRCKHTWEDHHHGCVMNPDYFEHPLTFNGLQAQECEATQTNGQWHEGVEHCECSSYKTTDGDLAAAIAEYDLFLANKEKQHDKDER